MLQILEGEPFLENMCFFQLGTVARAATVPKRDRCATVALRVIHLDFFSTNNRYQIKHGKIHVVMKT